MSADEDTVAVVGKRYGAPVVLTIDSAAVIRSGFIFYMAENGVWLTESVPVEFLTEEPGDLTVGS